MNDYYLLMQGSKIGPLSLDTVSEYLAKGKITTNQMVSVDNGDWVRLFETESFRHLAPKVEEKKLFVKVEKNFGSLKLVFILANMSLFGLFMAFNFYKFPPGHFGVWLQLLMASCYTLVLSDVCTTINLKKSLDIIAYGLLLLMWLGVGVSFV